MRPQSRRSAVGDPGIHEAEIAPNPEPARRPGLLILFAPADHPHRDAVCATVAWLAVAEGLLFECYYDSRASGVHFGGGLPWRTDTADLRGGTFTGAHHLEQFELVLDRFECQAACLGETIFADHLADAGVCVRAKSADVADFYRQLFERSPVTWPSTLLVVGSGAGPISLVPYACHEVVQRRLLAISGGDESAREKLAPGMQVEHLWGDEPAEAGHSSVATRSVTMAKRWSQVTSSYLLADPEVAGRWIPTAVREGWAPVYGIPQADVVAQLLNQLDTISVVWGRQQDDRDFLELSKTGTAFQLVDPGRPPFPILGQVDRHRGTSAIWTPPEPSEDELKRWAIDGRVVSTIVFWAGMIRELECLYGLAEILNQTGLKAGLALTSESFKFSSSTPLGLLTVPPQLGGLSGQVDVLLASAGGGAMIESAAPADRFDATLKASVAQVAAHLGGADHLPRGWWGVMDAPLLPAKSSRVKIGLQPLSVKLRYRPRPLSAHLSDTGEGRSDFRARVRQSPLGKLFEPIRPFDDARPGPPLLSVLNSVRSAGFEFALTKAEFDQAPTLATGVDGLSVINYTAGRWDGWTPFETLNDMGDLRRAERRLLRSKKPGWLLGGIDSCLWTFSGHLLERGRELRDMCRWLAEGGESGRLHNVTPGTAARYARVLGELGLIRTVSAR